nr:hypothetical protein [Candidatus Sigynarchaeota archaeon]
MDDAQNDVQGGTIVADTGAEHYNVTCGNTTNAQYLDIKSITWTNDSVNYTITMAFWNPLDMARIISGNIWGGIDFSVNGSSIDAYQLGTGFTGDVFTWYIYIHGAGVSVPNCAVNSSSAITWTFSKSTLTSNVLNVQDVGQWSTRAYIHCVLIEESFTAWDEINYPTYPETHGITCVSATPGVDGFVPVLVGLAIVVASLAVAGKMMAKPRLARY